MPIDPSYDLNRLALFAGVTPRAVRFYIQQGLLPPADAPGLAAPFRQVHLDRVQLIRELQQEGLSIPEMRAYLQGVTPEGIGQLLETTLPARVTASIIDDVRRMLAASPRS